MHINPRQSTLIATFLLSALCLGNQGAPLQRAPSFEVTTLSGKHLSFRTWENRIVLIDFWASWCLNCRKSLSQLALLSKTYAPSGIEVLAISVDSSDKILEDFVRENDLSKDLIARDSSGISKEFSLVGIPYSVLIIDGQISLKSEGPLGLHKEKTENVISKALKARRSHRNESHPIKNRR